MYYCTTTVFTMKFNGKDVTTNTDTNMKNKLGTVCASS